MLLAAIFIARMQNIFAPGDTWEAVRQFGPGPAKAYRFTKSHYPNNGR